MPSVLVYYNFSSVEPQSGMGNSICVEMKPVSVIYEEQELQHLELLSSDKAMNMEIFLQ